MSAYGSRVTAGGVFSDFNSYYSYQSDDSSRDPSTKSKSSPRPRRTREVAISAATVSEIDETQKLWEKLYKYMSKQLESPQGPDDQSRTLWSSTRETYHSALKKTTK